VRDRGGIAGVFPADVADPGQADGALTRIAAELGRVSILISNAAVLWPLGPTVAVTLAEWSAAFAVNVGAGVPAQRGAAALDARAGLGADREHLQRHRRQPGRDDRRQRLRRHQGRPRSAHHQPGRRTGGQRGNGQRLPSRIGGYRHASLDPRPAISKIGAALHERFARSCEEGSLITPGQSARSLMGHLASGATGKIWNVNTSRPEE